MPMLTCHHCGRGFRTRAFTMRFCSEACRDASVPKPERLPPYDRVISGPYVPNLTDDQLREIRARYAQGAMSCRRLAPDYGVCHTTILRVVKDRW